MVRPTGFCEACDEIRARGTKAGKSCLLFSQAEEHCKVILIMRRDSSSKLTQFFL